MPFKVKAHRKLFEKWLIFGNSMMKFRLIIQHDHTLSDDKFKEWKNAIINYREEWERLYKETMEHITQEEAKPVYRIYASFIPDNTGSLIETKDTMIEAQTFVDSQDKSRFYTIKEILP